MNLLSPSFYTNCLVDSVSLIIDTEGRSIFGDYVAGESLTNIAHRLNTQDAPTARGGKWYPATVRYILTNGFYAGIAQYEDTETPASHTAIINASTYNAAISLLQK